MAEVVVWRHPERPAELVIDSDDIAEFETPSDVLIVSCDEAGCPGCNTTHRQLGTAHLNVTFKPGKRALWREVAAAAV